MSQTQCLTAWYVQWENVLNSVQKSQADNCYYDPPTLTMIQIELYYTTPLPDWLPSLFPCSYPTVKIWRLTGYSTMPYSHWDIPRVICIFRSMYAVVLPSVRDCRGRGEWRLGWLRLAMTSARCARDPAAPLRSHTGTASRPPWRKPSKTSTLAPYRPYIYAVKVRSEQRKRNNRDFFRLFACRPQPGGFKFLSASTREWSLSRSVKLNTGPFHCERKTGIRPPHTRTHEPVWNPIGETANRKISTSARFILKLLSSYDMPGRWK